MTVKAILSRKGRAVVTLDETASLFDAVIILDEHQIGAVVITGGSNRIVGILSERDIVRALARNARVFGGACRLCDEPVKQFMTRKVETCSESSTVYGIMERMTAGKFRHLPVVENGEPVGIVSIGDVVKHRLGDMESESNALRQYILTA